MIEDPDRPKWITNWIKSNEYREFADSIHVTGNQEVEYVAEKFFELGIQFLLDHLNESITSVSRSAQVTKALRDMMIKESGHIL